MRCRRRRGTGRDPEKMMTRMKIPTFTSGIRFYKPKNMGTEGHKVKMSQWKAQNRKSKIKKQPHIAPHPQKIVSNPGTLIYMGTPAQFKYHNCLVFVAFASRGNPFIFKVYKIIMLLIWK